MQRQWPTALEGALEKTLAKWLFSVARDVESAVGGRLVVFIEYQCLSRKASIKRGQDLAMSNTPKWAGDLDLA